MAKFNTDLLKIIACPIDKMPLKKIDNYLINPRLNIKYPIINGIPNLLESSGRQI